MDILTPIYDQTVAATGINPDAIIPRCRSLATFTYFARPTRRVASSTPKVGVKPKRKKVR